MSGSQIEYEEDKDITNYVRQERSDSIKALDRFLAKHDPDYLKYCEVNECDPKTEEAVSQFLKRL